MGIPPVVSPVGANKKLVTDCANGFLVESDDDWYHKLEILITNADTRVQIGNNARNRIVSNYSVQAVEDSFFKLFEQQ
jgi:glycosyltransferase involved in cell wall biosynthesis